MSVSPLSSTANTPAAAVPASQKPGPATSAKPGSAAPDTSAESAARAAVANPRDAHFNVQMPRQAISNGLGQTIGQHINLSA